MVRALRSVTLTLSLVAFPSTLGAGVVHFEPVSSETGSPSDVITAPIQDRDGFVWIGTREGSTLYDGYTLISFVQDPSRQGVLPDLAPRSASNNREKTLPDPEAQLELPVRFKSMIVREQSVGHEHASG